MTRFIEKVGPAMSRTLVKPRMSVRSASSAALKLRYASVALSSVAIGSAAITAWTWASISPGIRVRPPPAITSAPSGKGRFSGSMALIFWPSTTTRTPVNTTGPLGASGARASVDLEGSTNAPTNKAAPPPRKVRRFRVPCRCWFSRAKAQETG